MVLAFNLFVVAGRGLFVVQIHQNAIFLHDEERARDQPLRHGGRSPQYLDKILSC